MNTRKRFFAAANGYTGFRSYFDTIFNSEDFAKIYVLKGGPGTGKSSLMNKLSEKFDEEGVDTVHIHCSSDPSSLDGVIFIKNGIRAAIIDGTAPHERDAVIPGAIDEIIDLGSHLDKVWLKAQRNEILELNKEKKNAYKTAYNYLSIAGTANAKSLFFNEASYDSKLSNMLIKSLAETNCGFKTPKIRTILISSFGRLGEVKLDTLDKEDYRHFSIVGNKEFSYRFLNDLYKSEVNKHTSVIRFPTALDDRKTEAILFPDENLLFSVFTGGKEINTEDFASPIKTDNERIKVMKSIENDALEESKRWFGIASDFHFRLEEIYSRCMDFSKNDIVFEEKCAELYNLFDI